MQSGTFNVLIQSIGYNLLVEEKYCFIYRLYLRQVKRNVQIIHAEFFRKYRLKLIELEVFFY